MIKTRVSFWNSIVSRITFVFALLMVGAILLSGYLVFSKAEKRIKKNAFSSINHQSELIQRDLNSLFAEARNDIALLASSPALVKYVQSSDLKSKQDLIDLFEAILANKPDYFQIRFLKPVNNGQEIIRLNKRLKEIELVSDKDLQPKGNREYFLETMKLKKGEYYFSNIDLNEENGEISQPETPTLRVATPIFDQSGATFGMVIINIDLKKLFSALDNLASNSSITSYLINKKGEFLFHSNSKFRFQNQLKHEHNFYSVFKLNSSIENQDENISVFSTATRELFFFDIDTFKSIEVPNEIFILSGISESSLFSEARSIRDNGITTLLIIIAVALTLAFFFTRLFSKRIAIITKAMSSYTQNQDYELNRPKKMTDEIDVLSYSFFSMKEKIEGQVQSLTKALDKARIAERERDSFLQNMSHELRTPLNSILGMTQLIRKNVSDEKLTPMIDSLERNAQNLNSLVRDVLDFKKLSEGNLELKSEVANVAKILNGIFKTYQFEAIKKGLQINFSISPELENKRFKIDELRLTQIITNLIVNAIKYTDSGSIGLFSNYENGFLNIKVKDTGAGISKSLLESLNRKEIQKDNVSFGEDSYGLGLNIVIKLIDLFGGDLRVTSDLGVGTSFAIKLKVESEDVVEKKPTILPNILGAYSVGYLDDDEVSQEMLKQSLVVPFIDWVLVPSINVAIEKFENGSIDILISDLNIGSEYIGETLKSNALKYKDRIVVISSMHELELKNLGFLWLQKPIDNNLVKKTILGLIGERELNPPNYTSLRNNYDGDQQKIVKILSVLMNEMDAYSSSLQNAFQQESEKEWNAVIHKMITHVRDLKLDLIEELISKNFKDISEQDVEKIVGLISFYSAHIFVEMKRPI